jgi:hypothetical protein
MECRHGYNCFSICGSCGDETNHCCSNDMICQQCNESICHGCYQKNDYTCTNCYGGVVDSKLLKWLLMKNNISRDEAEKNYKFETKK